MQAHELAERIGARVLTRAAAPSPLVGRVVAGDRMSDLIEAATANTLLVTHLDSLQLLRAAGLMDVPVLCYVGGLNPCPETLVAAEAQGMLVLVSPFGLYETCGRLYQLLGGCTIQGSRPPAPEPVR